MRPVTTNEEFREAALASGAKEMPAGMMRLTSVFCGCCNRANTQDLLFADPYGGRDALYRKTKYGFVIYSRSEDGVDDGFLPETPDLFRERDVMSYSNDKDEGLVICYDPIVPVP